MSARASRWPTTSATISDGVPGGDRVTGTRLGLRLPHAAGAAFGAGVGGDVASGGGGGVVVLHANLVLRLGQTLAMVLTRDEAADTALVVAITCDPAGDEPEG